MNRGRDPNVPLIPGYSVSQPPAPAGYAKKQMLKYVNGYAVPVTVGQHDDEAAAKAAFKQQQDAEAMWKLQAVPPAPITAGGASAFAPKYVQYDKKVLRFFGWFHEAVVDSPLEAWRTRKVCILLYLEDDTMAVTEPPQTNSGIMQGTMVRRHKLPKEGGGILGLADLVVGGSVKVYGREVHIVDADGFTREFTASRGIRLVPAQPYPVNPIDVALARRSKPSGLSRSDPDSPSKFAEALLGREHNSKSLQQFLQHGGEVLRFWALIDDRQTSEYGMRTYLKLHYFVADSTAEIMEVHEPNNGKANFPSFLKRGPLPRVAVGGTLPGQARLAPEQCYGPQDLRIGVMLTVLGRQLFIYDCDDATRKWYMERLGFAPEQLAPIDISEPPTTAPAPALPPHNGFGSLEDSMQNCLRLVPKAVPKDPYRWATLDHVVLRFEAVLEQAPGGARLINIDRDRRFVVSFFVVDQTLAVFEPVQKNSGLQGGKFLERSRAYRPGSNLAWYTEVDMKIGAVLDLHGRRFRLVSADAYTEQYFRNTGVAAH